MTNSNDIEGHTYAGDGFTDKCERCGRPESAHPDDEARWDRGYRAAWTTVLENALKALGYDSDEAKKVAWISERERTVAALREVCEAHGDNDWSADLHLADVVEKHLHRHLG